MYRLHKDPYKSAEMLANRELELAIKQGDQIASHANFIYGQICLAKWYTNKAPQIVHIRQMSYLSNPFKHMQFNEPWWWKHPLYIENCRAYNLYEQWHAYKDKPGLEHYLKPKKKVPFIQPHPTLVDLWETPDGRLSSDIDLWRASGWIAEVEDKTTRMRKLGIA